MRREIHHCQKKSFSEELFEDLSEEVVEDGFGPCESVERRFKLRQQMAATPGKNESVSLSLFMEVHDFEVEEELSSKATLFWAEGVWMGRWRREQLEAKRKQIF